MERETLSAFDAKTHFGTLLDRVQSGEEIIITRRGEAVARVIPEGIDRREDRSNLAAAIRASRALIGASPTPVSARELIDEGRKY